MGSAEEFLWCPVAYRSLGARHGRIDLNIPTCFDLQLSAG